MICHCQIRTIDYQTSTGQPASVVAPAVTIVSDNDNGDVGSGDVGGYGDVPALGAHTESIRREFEFPSK
jgi:hypothetical protein